MVLTLGQVKQQVFLIIRFWGDRGRHYYRFNLHQLGLVVEVPTLTVSSRTLLHAARVNVIKWTIHTPSSSIEVNPYHTNTVVHILLGSRQYNLWCEPRRVSRHDAASYSRRSLACLYRCTLNKRLQRLIRFKHTSTKTHFHQTTTW